MHEVRDLYHRVYREPPYHEDGAAADLFATQFAEHASLPGFAMTTVRDGDALGGFAYGVRRDGGWWHPRAATPAPPGVRWPLFYVYELVVAPELRGRGHGRDLLDRLLADRPERLAVLAASTEAPAREMYDRWGWAKVGELTGGAELLARAAP